MPSKKLSLIFGLLICSLMSTAQLSVQGGYTALQLAQIIAGPNLTVANASIIGATGA